MKRLKWIVLAGTCIGFNCSDNQGRYDMEASRPRQEQMQYQERLERLEQQAEHQRRQNAWEESQQRVRDFQRTLDQNNRKYKVIEY